MEEVYLINSDSFQITQTAFFIRLIVATGIGFVIGLEREHTSIVQKEPTFAGIRTFIFVVLSGFIATFLGFAITHMVLISALVGVIVITSISYWISAKAGQLGATTEIALVVSFLLGCNTFMGFIQSSLALTVIIVLFLSLKVTLAKIIGRITQEELYAFIQFVVLALLIFPFLPDKYYGPYNVINPREVGWVIVLTSGFGFLGYILIKFLGSRRGILLTGILGGLVSSTVVAWVFSNQSKSSPSLSLPCAVAILAASTMMVIRVYLWVIIFNPSLISNLILPLFLILIAGFGVAFFLYRRHQSKKQTETEIPLGDPLNLKEAVFFGIFYTGILLLVSYANTRFGSKGIYISSAVAGLTDIDAITISISKLANGALSMLNAQNAILLAALSNTIVKLGLVLWKGSNELKKYVLIGFGLIFTAGIVGFFILNL